MGVGGDTGEKDFAKTLKVGGFGASASATQRN